MPKPAVFCPPVVTLKDGRNAKADNVYEGVTLPVECDEKPSAALSFLREILGDPTAIVASGGEWTNPNTREVEEKVYAHWRLNVPTKTPQEHAMLREARDHAKFDSYEAYLNDKRRPLSRGGIKKAWHSHVLQIGGHAYSFLGLGFRQWAYKSDTVSFDWHWNEAQRDRNIDPP